MKFTNPLVAGLTLIRSAIRSLGYVAGVTGWSINKDGSSEFQSTTVRGTLMIGGPTGARIEGKVSASIPFFELWSGDVDEQAPAYIANDPALGSGIIPLRLISSDRDDSIRRAEIDLNTGSDALPNATQIALLAEALQFSNTIYALNATTVSIDIDGTLTYTIATQILALTGRVTQFTGEPVPSRAGTTKATTSSAAISTVETVVISVTAYLTNGATYRITSEVIFQQSVATDTFYIRIRADSVTGTQIQGVRVCSNSTASVFNEYIEGEFTATATGNKTFVVTLIRNTGTGTITMTGNASSPAFLHVDYIRT